ncbi:TPA: hypothetical protein QCU24_005575 [Bacillus cereus]|nr:hypothetical protein [Bacillus cereus]
MKSVVKWGCFLFIILAVLGGVSAYFVGKVTLNKVDELVKNPGTQQVKMLSAEQYIKEVVQNSEVINNTTQIVEVTGVVKNVYKDHIELEEGKLYVDIQKGEKISYIKNGTTITVRGIAGGYDKEKGEALILKGIIITK